MKIKAIPRTIGKYTLTALLTVGVIVAFGVLSASGMLLVTPSILVAVAAFVFGGVVEGEVFKQEIFEGLHDFAMLGKQGYRQLIVSALDRALKAAPEPQGFLREYSRIRRYLEDVRGKKLTDAQKAEKKDAQKRLKHMRHYFAKLVLANQQVSLAGTPFEHDTQLSGLIHDLQKQMPAVKAKMALFRVALPFSLLCGVGFGLATAAALPAALTAISVSLGFLVWPLAVMAAVGYTFLIFHTMKDLIFSETFQKWKNRIKNWFTPDNGIVTPIFVLKAVGTALLVAATLALCVMGTLATAGTWWLAVKHGAKLIPYVQQAASWIRNITTPLAAFGNFIFSVYNSFKSIHVVMKAIKTSQPIVQLNSQWQKLLEKENLAQILNPFRLVCKVVQKSMDMILLLGHTVASGAARDQFLTISPALLTATSAGSEFTQDLTFFFEEGKKTMTQWAVTGLLAPLLFISASWQYLAGRCNPPQSRISFGQALRDAFGVTQKDAYLGASPVPSSSEFRHVEINRYFKKEEKRLENAIVDRASVESKKAALGRLKKHLIEVDRPDRSLFSRDDRTVLCQHRFFHSRQPARSELFAERMLKKFNVAN